MSPCSFSFPNDSSPVEDVPGPLMQDGGWERSGWEPAAVPRRDAARQRRPQGSKVDPAALLQRRSGSPTAPIPVCVPFLPELSSSGVIIGASTER